MSLSEKVESKGAHLHNPKIGKSDDNSMLNVPEPRRVPFLSF